MSTTRALYLGLLTLLIVGLGYFIVIGLVRR